MFVDASALVAMLLQEEDAEPLAQALESASERFTSPVAIFETVAVVMTRKAASRRLVEAELDAVLKEAGIEVIAITGEIGRAALDAFDRYGKGRGHPAQLNMGDCFAYGAAMTRGVPLLYKGDDFAETALGRE
jgi:ribonuclease VapC